MIKITVDVIDPKPNTIYAVLKRKLGREPTLTELCDEVRRILNSTEPREGN